MGRRSTRSESLRPLISVLAVLFITLSLLSSSAVAPQQTYADGEDGNTAPSTTCVINFTDVTGADYFYEPVQSLYCKGAVAGYSDNTFHPYDPTTRGQLSKIIVLATGLPLDTNGGPHFSDVLPDSPFYNFIETAYSHGLISGYDDGTFRPGNLITRGQLTKVVVTAKGWPLVTPATPTFEDVPPYSAYFSYIETAVQHQIISGHSDGTFGLGDSATRGQICKIIYAATVLPFSLTTEEQQTVDLINQGRAAMGLGALRVNSALTRSARRHSDDIGPRGLCQHIGTDNSSPWDRIAQAGYNGSATGEVVGCGYNSAQNVVGAWWNSPDHFAILTNPDSNDIGCGWWIGPNGYGWQTCDTGYSDH